MFDHMEITKYTKDKNSAHFLFVNSYNKAESKLEPRHYPRQLHWKCTVSILPHNRRLRVSLRLARKQQLIPPCSLLNFGPAVLQLISEKHHSAMVTRIPGCRVLHPVIHTVHVSDQVGGEPVPRHLQASSYSATMGFLLSKSMDANFKKQQEFMLHNARLQMERQIVMQNQMRERQMAMQVAWSREFLKYYGTFFTLATVGLTVGAIKRRKPFLLAPIIPLGFIMAYQVDSAYGTLIYRVRGEAESIMTSDHDRLDLPHGTPTFESIEKARRARSSLASFLEK
ncbi:hypothetical protein F7725_015457 [Dissostichus mawsoni]|uniref:Plasminogen receptor (KT) n=2 Tax=Dissostichus TaxID=36199 RepID=A0A7J5YHU8_DISMA|nr:hypothetical protein F7725_015457 [Dissostichus mawsoni]